MTSVRVDAAELTEQRLRALCELTGAAVEAADAVELTNAVTDHFEQLGFEGFFAYVHDGLDEHLVSVPEPVDLGALHHARQVVTEPGTVAGIEIRLRDGAVRQARVAGIWKGVEPVGVLGVIRLASADTDEVGDQILLAIARQASAAVERASARGRAVYQAQVTREYQIAADVQRSLLPKRRAGLPTLDVGAKYVPSTFVGGDFYDWHAVEEGVLVAHVGDVSGKGMSAAVVMSMAQMLTRAAIREGYVCPATMAEVVNSNLYGQLVDIGAFVTMIFLRYEAGVLSWSNAGHSPVILNRKGEAARVLEAHGPPVGVLDSLTMDSDEVPFVPGDLLLACSDGIVEQRNLAGELFGYERLVRMVDGLDHLSAQQLADRVMLEVEEFAAGTPGDDDRAILVLKPTDEG